MTGLQVCGYIGLGDKNSQHVDAIYTSIYLPSIKLAQTSLKALSILKPPQTILKHEWILSERILPVPMLCRTCYRDPTSEFILAHVMPGPSGPCGPRRVGGHNQQSQSSGCDP